MSAAFSANSISERKDSYMKKTNKLRNEPKQEPSAVSAPHDKGYKKSLSQPGEFLHFLQKYIGADWMMVLKESDLSLCDKEMLERDYEGKEADLLYRVTMPDGREVFIFILQELQSYVDYTMVFRILIYIVNTLVKYFMDTGKKERERAGFRLPAIVPIVFYNGQDRWTAVKRMKDYQEGGVIFGDYILNLEYYLVNLAEIEEEYILLSNTVLDNIMYCDKYRKKQELVAAVRTAYGAEIRRRTWHFSIILSGYLRKSGQKQGPREEQKELQKELQKGEQKESLKAKPKEKQRVKQSKE